METKQINELERLLEEYRELVSMADTSPKANQETVTKLNQEKEQLTKEVAELNQTIKHLKAQLEFAESRVSNYICTDFQNLPRFCSQMIRG